MKIPLSKFESVIEPVIVSRGEEYFDDEAVRELKQLKDGEWIASVEGTEVYKVRISFKGKNVHDYSCSCPYDMGPVCKHVVAVLFAVREGEGDDLKIQKKQMSNSKKSTKSTGETFEQMVSRIPREDLNAIIIDYAGRESGIVDYISARRTIKASSSDKEEYRQIIQDAVDAVRGRHGFIGYWQASRAVTGAEMVLDKAQEFLERRNLHMHFQFASASWKKWFLCCRKRMILMGLSGMSLVGRFKDYPNALNNQKMLFFVKSC